MQESDAQREIVKKYKSIKTKSFVNRNSNDPNAVDFSSMSHEQLIIEATRLQRFVSFN
jgi:phage tail sheath gpL-like